MNIVIYKIFVMMILVTGIGVLSPAQSAVREYWITAEKIPWNYAPSGQNLINAEDGLGVWGKN
ncbi:hypothetical protein METHB2_70109 [Candidatus Methylobacter favarea]|uniref:Uncharacterized protein n=1 Tax=Candidatus Methylobacter favarea TaxID=2707345 RepID=A0A8S0XL23_9GAMM|nr:hypothetical protein METHB2_70109 [Candidatus Methylobacter favarea]